MVVYSLIHPGPSLHTKPLLPSNDKHWHDTFRSVLLLVTCVGLGLLGLWLLALATWPPETTSSQVHVAISSYRPATAGMGDIMQPTPISLLVVYVYAANSDPACADNLRFFIRTAVKENDGAHYIFAVQLVWCMWYWESAFYHNFLTGAWRTTRHRGPASPATKCTLCTTPQCML